MKSRLKPVMLPAERRLSAWKAHLFYFALGVLAGWILTYGTMKTRMYLAAEFIADGHPVTAYHLLNG